MFTIMDAGDHDDDDEDRKVMTASSSHVNTLTHTLCFHSSIYIFNDVF